LSPSPRAVSVQRAGPCSACTTRVSGRQPASSAWGSCSGAGTDLTKMRTRRSRARRRPLRYRHTPRAASFLRAWLQLFDLRDGLCSAERPERLQHPQRRPARCAAGSQGRADYHVRRDKLRGLRCACPPQSARRAVCAPRGTFARSDRPGASHRGRGGARRPLQERATTPPASTSSCQSSAPGCRPPPALPRPRAPALSRGNARLQNPTKNAAESPKLDGRWKMLWTDEREVRPRPRPRPRPHGGGGGARGVAAAAVSPSSSSSGSSGSSEGGICRGGAPDAAAARRRCCSWWRRAFSGTHASPSTRQRRARRARRKQPAGAAASPGAGLRRAGGRARVRRGAGLRRGGGLAEQRGGVRQRKPPRGAELLRAPRLTARPAPAPPRRPAPRAGARRRDAAPGAAASTSSSGRRC